MAERRKLLGDILIDAKLITKEQLQKALELQKKGSKEPLGTLLIRMGAVTEKQIAATLSQQLGIPFVAIGQGLETSKDPSLAKLISEEFARQHYIVPLSFQNGILKVAVADPTDILILDDLRLMSGCQSVERVTATTSDINATIDALYGEGGMLRKAIEKSHSEEERVQISLEAIGQDQTTMDHLVKAAEMAPVIQMADLLLKQAIKMRASDIHIEPYDDGVNVRYRIDGILHEMPPPAKSMAVPLVSRIKILSGLDISEKRLPQDGNFKALMDLGKLVDFRVSTVPTIFGEKVVIRILDKSSVPLDLKGLGFSQADLDVFRAVIRKPYGLILMTGPTGSGKTTTLYAALNELKDGAKNIMTVEDPVEYQMKGINQVQARPEIGLTFAMALRAFLRQDPDVILVGETRDLETAQICIRASLTGHLVFSTLHTNDAPSSITRLIDIGIEPFYLNASLLMVIAQRLIRRLCKECKEPYTPDLAQLPPYLQDFKGQIYRAVGCEKCGKSGFRGRLAIHEILVMHESLEQLINQRASISVLREAARKTGMRTLQMSGFEKVINGETTIEEVHNLTIGV